MSKENFSRFQFFKDVNYQTDRRFQPHYSEKGGHKARSEAVKTREEIHKAEVWEAKRVYEMKKQEAKEHIVFKGK
jgi:hypothetical protein